MPASHGGRSSNCSTVAAPRLDRPALRRFEERSQPMIPLMNLKLCVHMNQLWDGFCSTNSSASLSLAIPVERNSYEVFGCEERGPHWRCKCGARFPYLSKSLFCGLNVGSFAGQSFAHVRQRGFDYAVQSARSGVPLRVLQGQGSSLCSCDAWGWGTRRQCLGGCSSTQRWRWSWRRGLRKVLHFYSGLCVSATDSKHPANTSWSWGTCSKSLCCHTSDPWRYGTHWQDPLASQRSACALSNIQLHWKKTLHAHLRPFFFNKKFATSMKFLLRILRNAFMVFNL